MKRSLARHIASALSCMIWLLLAAGCQTPVGVEHVDASTAQRQLTANALTADELSLPARNVLRRWVLSERYDDDPAGAIAALHQIAADGRGDEDEVITLVEMAYLYGEKTNQRPYFLAAAIYSFAFLFPEKGLQPPSPYDPRLRLAADLYSLGLVDAFASADDATVDFRSGFYELPFGRIQVAVNPSGFEWRNRRIVALTPVQEVEIRGLANRYRRAGSNPYTIEECAAFCCFTLPRLCTDCLRQPAAAVSDRDAGVDVGLIEGCSSGFGGRK